MARSKFGIAYKSPLKRVLFYDERICPLGANSIPWEYIPIKKIFKTSCDGVATPDVYRFFLNSTY